LLDVVTLQRALVFFWGGLGNFSNFNCLFIRSRCLVLQGHPWLIFHSTHRYTDSCTFLLQSVRQNCLFHRKRHFSTSLDDAWVVREEREVILHPWTFWNCSLYF
jgi:hypothetical protein